MEYVYILPMVEVLVFNVITLDHCFKRKYSKFKMVAVFFFFTVLCILPAALFKRDVFNGDGKFSIFGFLYIIPLKFLYDEKIERLFLNMCMSWTYTLGILAVSIQMVYLGDFLNYDLSLIIIETVLFLATFIPLEIM